MTLSHDELRSLLAVSALNALPEDEAEQLERHLKRCSHCRAEMSEFGAAAALLAGPPKEAPEGVWEGIVATIGSSAPDQMPGTLRRVVRRRSWWVQGWGLAAAAALIAVVVLAVSTASLQSDVTHLKNQASSGLTAALGTKGRQLVELRNDSGIDLAEAVLTPSGGSYLVPKQLSTLPDSRTYQLWALSSGKPVSLGVLGADPGISQFRVETGMTTLMITAEPEGGVPAPSSGVLAQGGIGT
jgi:hypothetical protein